MISRQSIGMILAVSLFISAYGAKTRTHFIFSDNSRFFNELQKWHNYRLLATTTAIQPERTLSAKSVKMSVLKAQYYQEVRGDEDSRNGFNVPCDHHRLAASVGGGVVIELMVEDALAVGKEMKTHVYS